MWCDAVVIGAGVAGLTAAGALSESFDRVAVVERDTCPTGRHRKGVPQAYQTHVLMPLGRQCVEDLFPGFTEDMNPPGSRSRTWSGRWSTGGRGDGGAGELDDQDDQRDSPADRPRPPRARQGIAERRVRPGLGHGVPELRGPRRITGVRIDSAQGRQEIASDLVVDAAGRGSKTAAWLEEIGYERPVELTVTTNCGYSSRLVRVPDDALPRGDARGSLPIPGITGAPTSSARRTGSGTSQPLA